MIRPTFECYVCLVVPTEDRVSAGSTTLIGGAVRSSNLLDLQLDRRVGNLLDAYVAAGDPVLEEGVGVRAVERGNELELVLSQIGRAHV